MSLGGIFPKLSLVPVFYLRYKTRPHKVQSTIQIFAFPLSNTVLLRICRWGVLKYVLLLDYDMRALVSHYIYGDACLIDPSDGRKSSSRLGPESQRHVCVEQVALHPECCGLQPVGCHHFAERKERAPP